MKKISKQLLSLMLVFAFVFVSVPITASAASKVETITLKAVEGLTYYDQDGFEFSEDDNEIYQEDYSYTIAIDPSSGDITFTASNSVIPSLHLASALRRTRRSASPTMRPVQTTPKPPQPIQAGRCMSLI